MRTMKRIRRGVCTLAAAITVGFAPISANAAQPALMSIGDSIGEGVQGADSAWQTQVYSYANLVSAIMQGGMLVPYIETNAFGVIGTVGDRYRIFPQMYVSNIAVSGADTNSLLYQRAQAGSPAEISNETELVMHPMQGVSQMDVIELARPLMILCWIGNNDVLSAATAFSDLNASQMTPIADFERDYIALADRLGALIQNHNSKVVFANIPDVTSIGFLADRAQAEVFTGFPVPLPEGHYTSIAGVILMSFQGNASLINDPSFVLDAGEVAAIQARTQVFNDIIQREADRIGMPVVDVNAKFDEFIADPPVVAGVTLRAQMFGGLFSLDGVHPSNIGHALIANEFIRTMNQSFNMTVPELPQELLDVLVLTDPSIDKDGDGQAPGRLGVGLLETLAFLAGLTGDSND